MTQGREQRITEILETYWNRLRGKRPFPLESEVNTDTPELLLIWDSCFLVRIDYTNAEHPYNYVYLGEFLVKAYGGEDAVAKEVCEALVYPSTMSMVHKFKEVADKGEAVHQEGEFTNTVGELIKFRSAMLPLGGQDGEVGYILGGMKWKAY